MRPNIIWIIFRKEITEALRDRVTLGVVVLLPLLAYPLMIFALAKVPQRLLAEKEVEAPRIAVWGELPAPLQDWLQHTNGTTIKQWAEAPEQVRTSLLSGSVAAPKTPAPQSKMEAVKAAFGGEDASSSTNPVTLAAHAAISRGKLDAVCVLWPGFDKALETGSVGTVSIYFDSVRESSEGAADKLEEQLREFRRHIVAERERLQGMPAGFARALDILSSDVASRVRRTGYFLGLGIPLLLMLLSVTGTLYVAIDITAGEKDRGTMETLLCAPLRPAEIVCGKLLTVWAVSLVSAFANIASMAASFSRVIASIDVLAIPLSAYALIFVLMLPVGLTISAFVLAVSVMARDAKDAGNFVTAGLMFVLVPLVGVMALNPELSRWTACVPLANIMLLIKSSFLGEVQAQAAFLTLVSSAVYAAVAIIFAARVFGREQILLGSNARRSGLFAFDRTPDGVPTPAAAVGMFCVAFVLMFYGSLVFEASGSIVATLLITQYGCLLLPTALVAFWMKFSAQKTFSLRMPRWPAIVGAALIGASAWAVLAATVTRFLPPPPEELVETLKKALLFGDKAPPLWLVLFLTAITPATCEELVFRGFILSGLRRLGQWPAILVSSLLFGLLHPSIYQFVPSFLLGVVLGWVVWKTGSVFCSIIIHALSNGTIATLTHLKMLAENVAPGALPWGWPVTAGAVFCVVLGIALVWRSRFSAGQHGEPTTVLTGR
jgi:sodium transport system permease protein